MIRALIATLVLAFTISTSGAVSAAASVGQPAPAFTAVNSNGKPVMLSKLRGKFVVLEWFNPGCPFTQKHYNSNNMQSLQKNYGAKGVTWLSVNTTSGPADAKAINAWEKKMKATPKAVLLDSDTSLARLYGAKTTPHLFVINPQGTVIYAGAIDDIRSADVEDIKGAKNYVSTALNEALAGKAVTTASTQPYGCSVKYN